MKVFEIVEAPGDDWTGRSAGGLIVPGGSDADVTSRPANRTPSNSTPAAPARPSADTSKLRVLAARGGEPTIELILDGKKYTGTPGQVMDALEADGNPRAATAIDLKQRRIQETMDKFERSLKWARRTFQFFGMLGVGVLVVSEWNKRAAGIASVDLLFKDVYKGGSFDGDDETYQRMLAPYKADFVKAVVALAFPELVQLVTAGQVVKLVRWMRLFSGAAASTGVGIFIAAVSFAITEGLQWVATWAVKKYGEAMIESLIFSVVNDTLGLGSEVLPTSTQANLERGAEEVRAKARQDRAEQANAVLRTLGQSNPALTAPGQSDDDFNRSLERLRGSN